MADYKDYTSVQYCMPSIEKRNVDEANKALGYNNLSDKANRNKVPQGLQGAKVRKQEMGGKFGY